MLGLAPLPSVSFKLPSHLARSSPLVYYLFSFSSFLFLLFLYTLSGEARSQLPYYHLISLSSNSSQSFQICPNRPHQWRNLVLLILERHPFSSRLSEGCDFTLRQWVSNIHFNSEHHISTPTHVIIFLIVHQSSKAYHKVPIVSFKIFPNGISQSLTQNIPREGYLCRGQIFLDPYQQN